MDLDSLMADLCSIEQELTTDSKPSRTGLTDAKVHTHTHHTLTTQRYTLNTLTPHHTTVHAHHTDTTPHHGPMVCLTFRMVEG